MASHAKDKWFCRFHERTGEGSGKAELARWRLEQEQWVWFLSNHNDLIKGVPWKEGQKRLEANDE